MRAIAFVVAYFAIVASAGLGRCPRDAKCCPLESGGCSADASHCMLNTVSCPSDALYCPLNPDTFTSSVVGKLNLQYRASDEKNKMHRALQILNPSPELSGEYKCTVSTYEQEASQSKKMVIYVPQSSIKFWHTVELDDREDNSVEADSSKEVEYIVNVTCAAEGVYPEPIIRIYSESKLVSDKRHMKTKIRNGLFDVVASIQVDDDDMNMENHKFRCELYIPEANYTVQRDIDVSVGNNTGTRWRLSAWLFFFTLTFAATAPSLL